MCPACCRSRWLLALMNSADRRPNHLIALGGAGSPWVWPIPGPAGWSSRLTTLAPHPAEPSGAGEVDAVYAEFGAA